MLKAHGTVHENVRSWAANGLDKAHKKRMERSLEKLALDLRLSEERFRTFMDNAPFVTYVKDGEGRYVFYNERMAARFGIELTTWLGKTDYEIWPKNVADTMHLNDQEVLASGESMERLEETVNEDGSLTTWKVHRFSWRNELGDIRLGAIGLDLSEELARERALAEANLQLQKLAATDSLTGLANRRVLDERIEYEFRIARRNGSKLSVVLLDIDNFKRLNDRFGHAAGDEVLRRLGALVISTLRITDVAARYGGEELVVLLPGADPEGSRIFAERLREKMRVADWGWEPITASFGTASLCSEITSGRELVEHADKAMYHAKRTGKNRVVDFESLGQTTGPEASGGLTADHTSS